MHLIWSPVETILTVPDSAFPAHSETINGEQLDLGAAVGLLTRNIKIIGEDYNDLYSDSFGARVIVGLTVLGQQVYTGRCGLNHCTLGYKMAAMKKVVCTHFIADMLYCLILLWQ